MSLLLIALAVSTVAIFTNMADHDPASPEYTPSGSPRAEFFIINSTANIVTLKIANHCPNSALLVDFRTTADNGTALLGTITQGLMIAKPYNQMGIIPPNSEDVLVVVFPITPTAVEVRWCFDGTGIISFKEVRTMLALPEGG
jgi:hypothetical protein